jgi:hypothetical protein
MAHTQVTPLGRLEITGVNSWSDLLEGDERERDRERERERQTERETERETE